MSEHLGHRQIVDGHYFKTVIPEDFSKGESSDPPKTIDCDFYHDGSSIFYRVG